jgi:hypothetical protein
MNNVPQNINDWETTEEWEYIWVPQRRYENIYNQAVESANNKDVKGFVKNMSSLADVKERSEGDLYAFREDPKHEIIGEAQMQLANFFLFGAKQTEDGGVIKTKKDLKKAVYYTKLSAKNGNVSAQQNLATMYEDCNSPDGEQLPDIEQDYKKALNLYRLAAKQGLEVAKKDGANLYKKMKGI